MCEPARLEKKEGIIAPINLKITFDPKNPALYLEEQIRDSFQP